MRRDTATAAPPQVQRFDVRAAWTVQPAAERLLARMLGEARGRSPRLDAYARRLTETCAVRLRDVVDHLSLMAGADPREIEAAGWRPAAPGVWRHALGYFPDLLDDGAARVTVRCERIETFAAGTYARAPIAGPPHGPYRTVVAFAEGGVELAGAERRGWAGHGIPDLGEETLRQARRRGQAFLSRRRQFDDTAEGLARTRALVAAAVDDLGPDWTCDLFMAAERDHWMQRCAAGRLQKARQDEAGLGWSNIDHHTYDSSRQWFAPTIEILELMGYECRELFYAGADAGWGSQILEQPALRSTIFADIDLAPDELDIDFAHLPLAPLPRFRRAGVWCGLHGESILDGGLNHVAGMFDHAAMDRQMKALGVAMMGPFSDFPHLYQALTEGDWRAVDPYRIDALAAAGHITAQEAEAFRLNGAVCTHLENLERNDGFKGFNQPGIDGVLRIIDPRKTLVS